MVDSCFRFLEHNYDDDVNDLLVSNGQNRTIGKIMQEWRISRDPARGLTDPVIVVVVVVVIMMTRIMIVGLQKFGLFGHANDFGCSKDRHGIIGKFGKLGRKQNIFGGIGML